MTTKRVAIAELKGAALDWAVAMAVCPESFRGSRRHDGTPNWVAGWLDNGSPSTDWSQGGLLIVQHDYALPYKTPGHRQHLGRYEARTPGGFTINGSSPLIAACRAIVAAHNPDGFVEVPDELVEEE